MNSHSYYTHDKLVTTTRFYLAQRICDDLLKAGVISREQYELLSDINVETFNPLFAEIRPKSLDK